MKKGFLAFFLVLLMVFNSVAAFAAGNLEILEVQGTPGGMKITLSSPAEQENAQDNVYFLREDGSRLSCDVTASGSEIVVSFDKSEEDEGYVVVNKNLTSSGESLSKGYIYKVNTGIETDDFSKEGTVDNWVYYRDWDTTNDKNATVYDETTKTIQAGTNSEGQLVANTEGRPSIFVRKDWLTQKYKNAEMELVLSSTGENRFFAPILRGQSIFSEFWQIGILGYDAKFSQSVAYPNVYFEKRDDIIKSDKVQILSAGYAGAVAKSIVNNCYLDPNEKYKVNFSVVDDADGNAVINLSYSKYNSESGLFEDTVECVKNYKDTSDVFGEGFYGFYSSKEIVYDYVKIKSESRILNTYTTDDVASFVEGKIDELVKLEESGKEELIYENIGNIDRYMQFLKDNGMDSSSLSNGTKYDEMLVTYNKFKVISAVAGADNITFTFSKKPDSSFVNKNYFEIYNENGSKADTSISTGVTDKNIVLSLNGVNNGAVIIRKGIKTDASAENESDENTILSDVWYSFDVKTSSVSGKSSDELKKAAEENMQDVIKAADVSDEILVKIGMTNLMIDYLKANGITDITGMEEYENAKKALTSFKFVSVETENDYLVLSFTNSVRKDTYSSVYIATDDGIKVDGCKVSVYGSTGNKLKVEVNPAVLNYIKSGKKIFVCVDNTLLSEDGSKINESSVTEISAAGLYDDFDSYGSDTTSAWKFIDIDGGSRGAASSKNILYLNDVVETDNNDRVGDAFVKDGKLRIIDRYNYNNGNMYPDKATVVAPISMDKYKGKCTKLAFDLVYENNEDPRLTIMTRVNGIKAVSTTMNDKYGTQMMWYNYVESGYSLNWMKYGSRQLILSKLGYGSRVGGFNDGSFAKDPDTGEDVAIGAFQLASKGFDFEKDKKYNIIMTTTDNDDGSVQIVVKVAEYDNSDNLSDYMTIFDVKDDGKVGGAPIKEGSFAFGLHSYKAELYLDNVAFVNSLSVEEKYNEKFIKDLTDDRISKLPETVDNSYYSELYTINELTKYLFANGYTKDDITGYDKFESEFRRFPVILDVAKSAQYNMFKFNISVSNPLAADLITKDYIKVTKNGEAYDNYEIDKDNMTVKVYNDKLYDSVLNLKLDKNLATAENFTIQNDFVSELDTSAYLAIKSEGILTSVAENGDVKITANFKNYQKTTKSAVAVVTVVSNNGISDKYEKIFAKALNLGGSKTDKIEESVTLSKGEYKVSVMLCESLTSLKQAYSKIVKTVTVE